MQRKILMGTVNEKGTDNLRMVIVDDSESDDPIAFTFGRTQGENGEPMETTEDSEGLAPEYVRGYEIGRKQWEATHGKTEVENVES